VAPIIKAELFKTNNITKALTNYAEENLIPKSDCDFHLKKVDTYVKSNATQEYELFSKEILQSYTNKEKIINENSRKFDNLFSEEEKNYIREHLETSSFNM